MKRQTALALALAGGGATLATIGWLGHRLLQPAPAPGAMPPGLIAVAKMPPEQGQAMVDAIMALTLPDLAGKPQAMAQWRGKVLVVNFWASWCKPCVDEMPALSRLNSHFAPLGVQFVGIGVDDAEKLAAFIRTTPVSYPVLVASPAGMTPGLQVRGLPYTVVIGRDGRSAMARLGRVDEGSLEPVLRRLLGQ